MLRLKNCSKSKQQLQVATPPKPNAGFTLLELLIALSLLAVITTTLFALFNSVLDTTGHARKHMSADQTGRAILTIIQDDLRYLHQDAAPPTCTFSTTPQRDFVSEQFLLGFTTTSSLAFTEHATKRSLQYVEYTIKRENKGYSLIRYERVHPTVKGDFPPVRYVLAERLLNCSFEYFNSSHNQFQSDWKENRLPAAVRLSFTLGTKAAPFPFRLVIPLPHKEQP